MEKNKAGKRNRLVWNSKMVGNALKEERKDFFFETISREIRIELNWEHTCYVLGRAARPLPVEQSEQWERSVKDHQRSNGVRKADCVRPGGPL